MCCKIKFVLLLILSAICSSTQAANWLFLQGNEPDSAGPQAKLWSFFQTEYLYASDTGLTNGPWAGQSAFFNQARPEFDDNEALNIIRARLGVRGQLPAENAVNYFLLAEFGKNAITDRSDGYRPVITDASITFSSMPGADLRIGQFKYPGSEEGLQGIHVFDYIHYTNVTAQLLLERHFVGDGSDPTEGNHPVGSIGAFRDIGIQLYNRYQIQQWEHSFAVMVGNGNGIAQSDNDGYKDVYLYGSSEQILRGNGPRRQGHKFYIWHQEGKRTLTGAGAGVFPRQRSGVGATVRRKGYRAGFEYIVAEGMIFNGTDGGAIPGARNNADTATASFNLLPQEQADGWYADMGYRFSKKWGLDIRYDRLDRGTRLAANERRFEGLVTGIQYYIKKQSRLILSHEFRRANAPALPESHAANRVLDTMSNRVSIQWLLIL